MSSKNERPVASSIAVCTHVGVCRLGTSQRLKGQLISFPQQQKNMKTVELEPLVRGVRPSGRLTSSHALSDATKVDCCEGTIQVQSHDKDILPCRCKCGHRHPVPSCCIICCVWSFFFFAALPTVPRTRQRLHGWVSKICPSRKFQT